MTSFARTVTRINRLLDALLSLTLAADQWPIVDGHLTTLARALEHGDRHQADGICLLLERQYCSSPYLLRTFETEVSWFARVPAPHTTLDLLAQVRTAESSSI